MKFCSGEEERGPERFHEVKFVSHATEIYNDFSNAFSTHLEIMYYLLFEFLLK